MAAVCKAPFPYFGGKSRPAPLVWSRFGDVRNYVEPFFGSGAILLARPTPFEGAETVNDLDGLLCNFWRALQAAPQEVAAWADWPVSELDLYARQKRLIEWKLPLTERLRVDETYFDAKAAGWWVWGICQWIGGGWCGSCTVAKKRPYLRSGGCGVLSERVDGRRLHLGRPYAVHASPKRKRSFLSSGGMGTHRISSRDSLGSCFEAFAARLRYVRVCCGDWSRVCGPTPTYFHSGITGVFLDPPYAVEAGRAPNLYNEDAPGLSADVRQWAIEAGKHPDMRVALCGYEGEHEMPADWDCVAWHAAGGYSRLGSGLGRENRHRERIWFSPACVRGQPKLF